MRRMTALLLALTLVFGFVACGGASTHTHVWEEDTAAAVSASCEADGKTVYRCTAKNCPDKVREDVIPAPGHSYEIAETVREASCTDPGEFVFSCTVAGCGHRQTGPGTAPKHSWNGGELTGEAQITYTCTLCGTAELRAVEPDAVIVTRADLEAAAAELAWDYCLKKEKVQYDSQELGVVGKDYGGPYRLTEFVPPEYGTEHQWVHTVCSDYIAQILSAAWDGYRMFGADNALNNIVHAMWLFSENQPGTDDDMDACRIRWKKEGFQLNELDINNGLEDVEYATDEQFEAFLLDWENTLRPGDVMLNSTHATFYVGNGRFLHAAGAKYNVTAGKAWIEAKGSVYKNIILKPTDYLDPEYPLRYYYKDYNWMTVLRPSDLLIPQGYDDDPGNDIAEGITLSEASRCRMENPAMDIDRIVNITPYGTTYEGDELTYSVRIFNKSTDEKYLEYRRIAEPDYAGTDYSDLCVTETIPAGTELVGEPSEGGVYDAASRKITWTVNLSAGKSVDLNYRVKVTAKLGETIVNDGGMVGAIPSNSISNFVGGTQLSEQARKALAQIAATDAETWKDTYGTHLTFAEKLYEAAGVPLDLPTLEEITKNIFEWTTIEKKAISYRRVDDGTESVFLLRDEVNESFQTVRRMLVDGSWGGYRFFAGLTRDDAGILRRNATLNECRLEYLEPGDIVVWIEADDNTGAIQESRVMVYAGDQTLLTMYSTGFGAAKADVSAEHMFWLTFQSDNDLFFILRPSQADVLPNAK